MVIDNLCSSYTVCKVRFVLFPRWELETGLAWRAGVLLWELKVGSESGEQQLWVGAEEEPVNDLFPLDRLCALPSGRTSPLKPEHCVGKLSALKGLHMLGCFHYS